MEVNPHTYIMQLLILKVSFIGHQVAFQDESPVLVCLLFTIRYDVGTMSLHSNMHIIELPFHL